MSININYMLNRLTSDVGSMDWLSSLLTMMPVSGQLELRCFYGAPWRVAYEPSEAGHMPYHVVVAGSAVLDNPAGGAPQYLAAGDILLILHGGAHVLHDGSGSRPAQARARANLNLTISQNAGRVIGWTCCAAASSSRRRTIVCCSITCLRG